MKSHALLSNSIYTQLLELRSNEPSLILPSLLDSDRRALGFITQIIFYTTYSYD